MRKLCAIIFCLCFVANVCGCGFCNVECPDEKRCHRPETGYTCPVGADECCFTEAQDSDSRIRIYVYMGILIWLQFYSLLSVSIRVTQKRSGSRRDITVSGSKGGLEEQERISELSGAIALLRFKNAVALLSSEILPRCSKPHFDPGRVICVPTTGMCGAIERHGVKFRRVGNHPRDNSQYSSF